MSFSTGEFLLFIHIIGHLQLDHEQLDLALLDELAEGLQQQVLRELLGAEHQALGRQVADSPVEHLQSEELLNEGVVLKQRGLQQGSHAVLVDEPALA